MLHLHPCPKEGHDQEIFDGEHCPDCLLEWVVATGSRFFYVQDTRSYVGNSMLWWAQDYRGYVCDIRQAHVWTKAEVLKQIHRTTDIPWPADYIDERVSHHIDMQKCRREDVTDG